MDQPDNWIFGEQSSSMSLKERARKYLINWPIFLISLLLCIGAGVFYIFYTPPRYIANTSFLVIGSDIEKPNSADIIDAALNGKRELNLNNEIVLLNSASLMERNVSKNGFNISYFRKDGIVNIDIYKTAPFRLIVKNVTNISSDIKFFISNIDSSRGYFQIGSENSKDKYAFRWGSPFQLNGQDFIFELRENHIPNNEKYLVRWQSVSVAAADLSKGLTIKAFGDKTNVIQLSSKSGNLQKSIDILNGLFTEFNLSDIEERSKLSESTVQFIDDRLINISDELKGVEGNLEEYQGSKEIVDIKGQSTQSLENSNDVTKTIKEISIQQGIVNMIYSYFSNPNNNSKIVPSSLGLSDGTLSLLINQYNELQLKKQRETPLVAPNSTVMQDLNIQLANLKTNILESLNNISKNLKLQENNFQQQNSQYKSLLSAIPHNERVLQEIKRKQSITEGLYLYLLQKREEAAISSTASAIPHYRQIDSATGFGPTEPNPTNIIVFSLSLGIFFGIGIIYLRNLLNDKIKTIDDITTKTSIPVIGEINHLTKKKKNVISSIDRSLLSEQFRAVRTNLHVLLKTKYQRVILITSAVSGEGKSFASRNLAIVCAIPGKRVALLEFDTRKTFSNNNQHNNNNKGLTDFLTGKIKHLSEISHTDAEIPSLHIYHSGTAANNPADLLLTDRMPLLFESLRAKYDYIIMDSPPIRSVTDAFILNEYSDLVIFMLRQGITLKSQIKLIVENSKIKRNKNTAFIFNDIKKSQESYYTYEDPYKV